MFVGPNVRNFDNLKLGDRVTMRYSEALALAIAKGGPGNESKLGEIRTKVEADAAGQAAPGGKPGMSAVAQDTAKSAAKKDGKPPAAVLLVVPVAFAADEKLGNGCWAKMYDRGNFTGSQYVMVGPVEVPAMRDGLGINEKYDSVIVGPKATLTVYDNANYKDKSAVLKAASRSPDLDDKMGAFETIRSLKMSCAP